MTTLPSQRRLIGACCAGLFVPLAIPLLTGRVFTKDDMAAWHLPFRFLYAAALRAGDSFLWTPAVRSGLYIHGEGEAGLAHPFHLLLYRVLPLGPAFNLEIIASYVAMLTGTALLLLRLGLPDEAAWFGGMLFAFSGFTLFNLMHVNHIATIAHAPWLLLSSYVLLTTVERRARALAFASVALVLGSQLLIGHPQYVWMTGLAIAFLTACALRAGAPPSRVPLLAGAMALGVLVGAAQLLPQLDFARDSTRQTWSLAQSLSFSLSPVNLVQLWSPFAFRFRNFAPKDEALIVHEFVVYNGAFCTVALAWIAARWREQTRRGLLTALLLFAAMSLVLAFGSYGGVYPWLARLPGVRNFRAPARHLVLFHLAMSGIAAIALEDLMGVVRRGDRVALRRLWTLAATVGMSVVCTLGAAALSTSAWPAARGIEFSSLFRAAPWAALVIGMAALVTMAARGVRWAVPAAIVCAAIDLGVWGYSYAYRWGPIQSIDELSASAEVPPGVTRGEAIDPMPGGGPINLPLFRGLHLVNGYFGVDTSAVLDHASLTTARLAGVAWRPAGPRWMRVADTMPRARLLSAAHVSRDVRADVDVVDVSRVALVDGPAPALSGTPGVARIVSDRPGRIAVDTMTEGRQLLVVTERFHAGWQVTEDGDARHAVPVYGDYLGTVVESGRHHVEFHFAPASARNGLRATIAGVALMLVATAVLW